jgi:CRP-like cAMP-binding protein
MPNPLIRKLENFVRLSPDEKRAIEEAAARTKGFKAKADIIHEDDPTDGIYLILSGWAFRYKVMPDGRRQIVAYFVPGDLCDQRIFILEKMDHCIGTITPAVVAIIPAEEMVELTDRHPRIARAL